MATNSDSNLKILTSLRDKLVSMSKEGRNLETMFRGIATSGEEVEETIKNMNHAIGLWTGNVNETGEVSTDTAKKIKKELDKVLKLLTNITSQEKERYDLDTFQKHLQNLADEEKLLEKIHSLEKEKDTHSRKQKKSSNLLSYYENLSTSKKSAYQQNRVEKILYATGGKEKDLNNLMIEPTTKTQKAFFAQILGSEEARLTEEEKKGLKGLMKDRVNLQEQENEKIREINIELEKTKVLHATLKQQIEDLLNVGVKSGVNLSEEQNQLINFSQKLTKEVKKAEVGNQTTIDLGKIGSDNPLQNLQKTLIGHHAIMRAIKSIGGEAIRTVRQMDEALTGMTVVTGKSREEVQALIPELRKMADATSATMTEVANLTTEYLRQGRVMEDAKNLAEATAKAAKISGLSTTETIEYMTAAINGFNLAATEAERVSDIFANVAAVSATDYEDLAVSLSKVSAQANLAGLSIEYTTALLAKGIETTQEAPESIGTALKTVIARMRELSDFGSTLEDGISVNQVEEAFKSAGLTLRNSAGDFRDLETVFNELGSAWDSLTNNQRQAIAQAAAGTRQQSRFIAIMQDWSRTLELVDESQNSAGASAYQYSQYSKGLEASFSRLVTSWQGFTSALVPTETLVKLINIGTKFLSSTVDVLEKLPIVKTLFSGAVVYFGLSSAHKKIQEAKLILLSRRLKIEEKLNFNERMSLDYARQNNIFNRIKISFLEKEHQAIVKNIMGEKEITEEKYKQYYQDLQAAGLQEREAKLLLNKLSMEKQFTSKNRFGNIKQILGTAVDAGNLNDFTKLAATSGLTSFLVTHKKSWKSQYGDIEKQFNKLKKLRGEYENIDGRTKEGKKLKKRITRLEASGVEDQYNNMNNANKNAKAYGKQMLKNIGITLILAAVTAVVVKGVSSLVDHLKRAEIASEKILENNNKIYETQQTKAGLQSLIDEYKELDGIINKTAEDKKRMEEIEESMRVDYNVADSADMLSSAETEIYKYDNQIRNAINDSFEQAIVAYTQKGSKIFDDATFKNAFNKKYTMDIDMHIDEIFTDSGQAEYSKNIAENTVDNINNEDIMQEAIKAEMQQDNINNAVSGGILAGLGGAAGGSLLGLAAAGLLSGPVGWLALGGAALAGIGAALWGATAGAKKEAKELAEITAQYMSDTQQDVAEFSVLMGQRYQEDMSFLDQYEDMIELLEKHGSDWTQAARNAIISSYESVSILSNADIFKDVQTISLEYNLSPKTEKELIEKFNKLGEEAAGEFFNAWAEKAEKSDSYEATMDMIREIMDPNSEVHKKFIKSQEDALIPEQNRLLELKTSIDSDDLSKAEKKELATKYGLDEYDKQTISEIVGSELNEINSELANLDNYVETEVLPSLLDTFSTISDTTTLTNNMTSLENQVKTLQEMSSAIQEGNIGLEQMIQLASSSAEAFDKLYQSYNEGDEAAMLSALDTGLTDIYNQRIELGQGYINRLEGDIAAWETKLEQDNLDEDNRARIQSDIDLNKRHIEVTKLYLEYSSKFNKTQLQSLATSFKKANLEKEIAKNNVKAYDELLELQKEEMANIEENIKTRSQGNYQYIEWVKQIRKGGDSAKQTWALINRLTDEEQQAFKQFYDNTQSYFETYEELLEESEELVKNRIDAIVSLQNDATEILKNKYQEEYEALKESLDKRKEAYEKYFDAIDEEREETDFATEQAKLQSAISRLSTATDAQSLAKRKEYEEELADLEKTRLDTILEKQRESVLNAIEDESDYAETQYNNLIEDTRKLWEEYTKMTKKEQEELFLNYKEGFKTATDEARQQMWSEYATIINGIRGASEGDANYVDPYKVPTLSSSSRVSAIVSSPVYSNGVTGNNSSLSIDNINVSISGDFSSERSIQETADLFVRELAKKLQTSGISVNLA